MNATATYADRTAAVAATMDRIKAIEHSPGRHPPGARRHQGRNARPRRARAALFPQPRTSRRRPRAKKAPAAICCKKTPTAASRIYLLALNPGNSHQAARPHHLGRRHRRGRSGTQPRLSPHRRRQLSPASAALELDREVMVEPGHGIALNARRHPLHPHLRDPRRRGTCTSMAWHSRRLDTRQGFDPDARHRAALQQGVHGPHCEPMTRLAR